MQLAEIFSHGAVVQGGKSIPVWGKAESNRLMEVTLADVSAYVRSGDDGTFCLHLPPLEPGGPFTLTVREIGGNACVKVEQVMVGEVFIASGQSNMEFVMRENPEQLQDYLAGVGDDDLLRMYVPSCRLRETNSAGCWRAATAANIADCSAVALWFAHRLRRELDVPVGIINCSWGGTPIEAWIGSETLKRNRWTGTRYREYLERSHQREYWMRANGSDPYLCFKDPGIAPRAASWHEKNYDDSSWLDFRVPGSWINQGFGGNGAFWARRHVVLPENWRGRDLVLELGGIDKTDRTWVNGIEVGATGSGNDTTCYRRQRRYRIPAAVLQNELTAVIAVRAYSHVHDGSFNGEPSAFRLRLADPGKNDSSPLHLAGKWRGMMELDWGGTNFSVPAMSPDNPRSYAMMFDELVRPVIPCAARAILWYQGESNAVTRDEAYRYRYLLRALLDDWRFRFGENLPFFLVQLAGYREKSPYEDGSPWAMLRESQRIAARESGKCRLVTAVDVGSSTEIHPGNKRTVGERLADAVLYHSFRRHDLPLSPEAISLKPDGCRGALIAVAHTGGALKFSGNQPRGFRYRTPDGHYRTPQKVDVGDEFIRVEAAAGDTICAIRYSWADNPDGNLCNAFDLPLIPFELEMRTGLDDQLLRSAPGD